MQSRLHLKVELEFERLVHQSRMLSIFRRNPSTWELLLKLASEGDVGVDGIYHAIEQVETRYLGSSAMLKFVRERRDDGLLQFNEHSKRSKWRISVEPSLREELVSLLALRNAELVNGTLKAAMNGSASQGVGHLIEPPGKASDALD